MYIGANGHSMICSLADSGHEPPSVFLQPFTVSVWLKPGAEFGPENFANVVGAWGPGTIGWCEWVIGYAGPNLSVPYCGANNGSAATYIASGVEHTETIYAVMTYDGSDVVRFYINGDLEGEATGGLPQHIVDYIGVGDPRFPANNAFRGHVWDLKIYGSALSAETIAENYAFALGHWMPIPGAPGWFVNTKGEISNGRPHSSTPDGSVPPTCIETIEPQQPLLRDIVADLFQRAGLTPDQYDVSQL